ncbi:MAG: hypothetical protein KBT48_00395 [Firmicutes bacterium]|nr:hypothetical protein [Bacillota bacterium]
MAKDTLFRKKTYERINSPEQLDQYLKASNPGLWFVLGGIILVLCGALVWSFFGRLDTKLACGARCENGILEIYVGQEHLSEVEKGMSVVVEDKKYTIETISTEPISASELGQFVKDTGKLSDTDWVYTANVKTDLEDGSYKADIIIDSVAPKTFILN